MTERDDLQEQASTTAVGQAPTDPAEEKRVQPAEALEEKREVVEETTVTQTPQDSEADSASDTASE